MLGYARRVARSLHSILSAYLMLVEFSKLKLIYCYSHKDILVYYITTILYYDDLFIC